MTTDRWTAWLRDRRDGGDASIRAGHAPALAAYREGVLDRARIAGGDIVLDVGAGTGLVGLGALERVGPAGRVVFSDVSAALLDECRRAAAGDPRCEFVVAGAEDLSAVPDSSVDVVTTRSVLIYVERKAAAFAEMRRVLRPGGRLSLFEPINRFAPAGRLLGLDLAPVADLAAKVLSAYPAVEAMVGFDERDLLRLAAEAGFSDIVLDYRAEVDVSAPPIGDWRALLNTAPNPLAPTYAEAIEATLSPGERHRLEACLAEMADVPTRRTAAAAFLAAECR